MSMYGRNTNNRFSGYYSDLPELIGQKPDGIDGEWVIITSLNKKYYWDISTRAWTDGGSIDATLANQATEETLQSIAGLNIPKHDTRQLVYTDGVLTSVVYKLAGATVATETLIYTDGVFTGTTIL